MRRSLDGLVGDGRALQDLASHEAALREQVWKIRTVADQTAALGELGKEVDSGEAITQRQIGVLRQGAAEQRPIGADRFEADFRDGSKPVLTAPKRHFRSAPINGHRQIGPAGPLGAKADQPLGLELWYSARAPQSWSE